MFGFIIYIINMIIYSSRYSSRRYIKQPRRTNNTHNIKTQKPNCILWNGVLAVSKKCIIIPMNNIATVPIANTKRKALKGFMI